MIRVRAARARHGCRRPPAGGSVSALRLMVVPGPGSLRCIRVAGHWSAAGGCGFPFPAVRPAARPCRGRPARVGPPADRLGSERRPASLREGAAWWARCSARARARARRGYRDRMLIAHRADCGPAHPAGREMAAVTEPSQGRRQGAVAAGRGRLASPSPQPGRGVPVSTRPEWLRPEWLRRRGCSARRGQSPVASAVE